MRERAGEIDAAAAEWAARVDRAPLTEAEQQALEAWAAADVRRAGAYAKARAVSAHFDRAQALGPDFVPARHPAALRQSRRRILAGGLGLAAAGLAGAAVFVAQDLSGRIATRKGDVRRVPLSDGSAVTLNTDSAVRPAFEPHLRQVALLRGEALFDVAKDVPRPFVVMAGPVRVRAVGTSFTVRRLDEDTVKVLVREGVVEVSRGAGEPPLRLTADCSAVIARSRPLRAVALAPGRAERATAWRQGLLDLDGMTLTQAAEEFRRYTDRRILIADPAVGAMRVAGLFSISDPDGFARAAGLSLGLSVGETPDGVQLSRAL
jgi:transmembrane sensor